MNRAQALAQSVLSSAAIRDRRIRVRDRSPRDLFRSQRGNLTGRDEIFHRDRFQFEFVTCGVDESLGYPSNGLIALLARLDGVPLTAWCDLDADGIGIIANLVERVGRYVHPVGMNVEFWAAGPYREQTTEAMALGRALAAKMADRGPVELQSLAALIAVTGEGREQETLHHEVLPGLDGCLRALENG
ncbi:hypothetical protein D5S18_17105 [Nocardia panacis]|uniref:Wadjet protein JetD C-terminal domain-containing protein n=1 Tax=Nocardia panacis TaxID=2340916 RepID=A0A3A4KAN2_9NOCA|nr:hypothetical protein D5S18_17105 [Nocardia panacis]